MSLFARARVVSCVAALMLAPGCRTQLLDVAQSAPRDAALSPVSDLSPRDSALDLSEISPCPIPSPAFFEKCSRDRLICFYPAYVDAGEPSTDRVGCVCDSGAWRCGRVTYERTDGNACPDAPPSVVDECAWGGQTCGYCLGSQNVQCTCTAGGFALCFDSAPSCGG